MADELLLWANSETAGLNDLEDTLLEVGMRVTDWEGNSVTEPFNQIILPSLWPVTVRDGPAGRV